MGRLDILFFFRFNKILISHQNVARLLIRVQALRQRQQEDVYILI